MGWRIADLTPGIIRCMNPKDRKDLGESLRPWPDKPADDVSPAPKTDRLEREEQRSFANWLLLQRSNGRMLPYYWAATHKRSTATPGIPDFGVGTWQGWIWLEFKRDYSSPISDEQKQFFADCEARTVPCYIVYSALKAIQWVNFHDQLS